MQERRARRRARRLARRTIFGRHPVVTVLVALILAATPVWYSLGSALTNPSMGPTIVSRAAEWLREHGGRGIVVWAEDLWYSHHQPGVGGKPAAGAIPPPPSTVATTTTTTTSVPPGKGKHPKPHPKPPQTIGSLPAGVVPLPTPAPLAPFATPAISGEGLWHAAGRTVGGVPAVYEAFMRPDALHTSLVAGVAWMDTRLLRATLYSGSQIPGGGPFQHAAPIPPSAAASLVALFNAGFLLGESNGGYYTDGRTQAPLRDGAASFVIYRNGSVNIGAWGADVAMTPDVVSVRQNLVPLVVKGQVVPGLNATDTVEWGFTLGNQYFVSRSGVGVTANGALVFVAGDLDITDLANLLVRAGAVRAMELDINPAWVDFVTYSPAPGALAAASNGTNLLSSMVSDGPARYFWAWWQRDFFTMSARY